MPNILGLRDYEDDRPSEYTLLVNAFRDRTLDKSKWTHEAHLVAGIWHIMNYSFNDALCRLKSAIISYNITVGAENTGTNGYHETITIFWLLWIRKFIDSHLHLAYKEMCDAFLASDFNNKNAPFDFYTKDKLLSMKARAMYVEPDVKEI